MECGLRLGAASARTLRPEQISRFFPAAAGTLLSFTALLLAAGFNRTPYLPSTYDWQHSLSISNSHASIGALAAVLVVGIVVLLAGAMWLVSRVRRFSGAEGEAS